MCSSDLICATTIGCGHRLLESRKFPIVLMDEATQATEPSALVPIVKGCRQLILVGDHQQLPPTVISRRAEQGVDAHRRRDLRGGFRGFAVMLACLALGVAAIAGIGGEEENRVYERTDDRSLRGKGEIREVHRVVLRAGDGIAFLPDDIHSIHVVGATPTRHLHMYGMSVEHLPNRVEYDMDAGTYKVFPASRGIRK